MYLLTGLEKWENRLWRASDSRRCESAAVATEDFGGETHRKTKKVDRRDDREKTHLDISWPT